MPSSKRETLSKLARLQPLSRDSTRDPNSLRESPKGSGSCRSSKTKPTVSHSNGNVSHIRASRISLVLTNTVCSSVDELLADIRREQDGLGAQEAA